MWKSERCVWCVCVCVCVCIFSLAGTKRIGRDNINHICVVSSGVYRALYTIIMGNSQGGSTWWVSAPSRNLTCGEVK